MLFRFIDEDFASGDFSGLFPNSAFGNSSAFSANIPESNYATLALGARLKIEPFAGAHASFAIYDGNAATALGDPSPAAAASTDFNKHNLNWALRGDEGALLACEIGYAFNQPEESAEAPADGAKGSNHKNNKPSLQGPEPIKRSSGISLSKKNKAMKQCPC